MTGGAHRPSKRRDILVVCGLTREAAIAAGDGIVAVAGGAHRPSLERKLAALDPLRLAAVVSFGLAGALDPALPVGSLLVAERVVEPDGWAMPADGAIAGGWRERLGAAGFKAHPGAMVGVDRPALSALDKARLRTGSGGAASAVDMESHVAARYAADLTLPFAILRVVSDPADRDLPPLVGRAMRPDGSVDLAAILGSLARRPGQIGPLIRTGRDAGAAFRVLGRVRGLLGPGLGLHL